MTREMCVTPRPSPEPPPATQAAGLGSSLAAVAREHAQIMARLRGKEARLARILAQVRSWQPATGGLRRDAGVDR